MKQTYDIYMPIQKSIDSAGTGDWIIEGIASTPGVDLLDDVVLPENFINTLDFFKKKGQIFYNHNYARKSIEQGGKVPMQAQLPIGRAIDAKLTPEGLYIKAILNKSHELAQDLWHNHLNNPDERFRDIGLSIGASPKGQTVRKYSPEHGRYLNYLPELILYEVSVTPTPVHPDTFARVMKSMSDEAELAETNAKDNNSVEIVNVVPEEAIYDSDRKLFVVKSVVQNEEGKTYILEQTIDLDKIANPKEDILKAMEDTKNEKKPAPSEAAKPETPETNEAPEAGAQESAPETPFGNEGEGAPEGAPGAESAPEGAPGAEGAPEGAPGAEGGLGDMMGGDTGGVDDLFGGTDGAPGAEGDPLKDGSDTGDTAANSMILDKLDTIVDALTTLVQDLASSKTTTTEGIDSTQTPPTDNPVDNQVLKSVELSTQMKDDMKVIVKSVVEEALLNGEFAQKVADLIIQNPVLKSISNDGTSEVIVRQPPVALSSEHNIQVPTVLKSFDGKELDSMVLKSLTDEYNSLTGSGQGISQRRGKIIEKAEAALGISDTEFRYLANKAARS